MQEKIERLSIEEIMKHCNRTCVRMELFAESQGITQDEIEDKAYWEHYQVKNYLEELRKYREIGTVGKVREYKEIVDNMDAVSIAALCISLNKLKEYQEIGTPDECLSNKNFLDFLYNHINPNDMEIYLSMYNARNEKSDRLEQ